MSYNHLRDMGEMEDNYQTMDDYEIEKVIKIDSNSSTEIQNQEDNLIDNLLSEKVKSIKDNIEQIVDLINERKEIQNNVFSNLENEILKVKDIIFSSSKPVIGYHTVELETTRDDLDSAIINLKKAMIDEKVASWRDVLDLKKELIELRKELKSMETKSKLFLKK